MGESSSLFCPPTLWEELGGLDERFALPGGGLVNHDLYRRACALHGVELVVLLGEGTFHQYHGGAATSRRLTWDDDARRLPGDPGRAVPSRPATRRSTSARRRRRRSPSSSGRPARPLDRIADARDG